MGFDILRWRYGTPSLRARDQVTLPYVAQEVYFNFYVFIYATGNSLGILRRFLPVVFWIIRVTANPVVHNSSLFHCYCNNLFWPKGPSSCPAYWPNVVFGCTLILIDFGISGSMFSVYLTPFDLRRVCKPNSICCWHFQTLCGSHGIYRVFQEEKCLSFTCHYLYQITVKLHFTLKAFSFVFRAYMLHCNAHTADIHGPTICEWKFGVMFHLQGVSGEIVNILGGGSMDYSE